MIGDLASAAKIGTGLIIGGNRAASRYLMVIAHRRRDGWRVQVLAPCLQGPTNGTSSEFRLEKVNHS